jgi:hypothetical protein
MSNRDFWSVLKEAVDDFARNGFGNTERLNYWMGRLRDAAQRYLPPHTGRDLINRTLGTVYKRLLSKTALSKYHNHAGEFPNLSEVAKRQLTARIHASADLIRLNREQAIEQTLRRFSGWASSVPAGGAERSIKRNEVKSHIGKPLRSASYEERRMLIDQGHKLVANVNRTIADDNGAIAMIWHSHWRQPGYDYREDHKERDLLVYAIRGNWAFQQGLMKAGKAGYLDEITQPAEEPYCRCFGQYLYDIADLPDDMLTQKGLEYKHAL